MLPAPQTPYSTINQSSESFLGHTHEQTLVVEAHSSHVSK